MKLTLNTTQELEGAIRINSQLEEGSELTIEMKMGNSTADLDGIARALAFGYNVTVVRNAGGFDGYTARITKAKKDTIASVTWTAR